MPVLSPLAAIGEFMLYLCLCLATERRFYMLKTSDIQIRDPFILVYDNKYYMYAQNFPYGFKAYVSSDLENWEEPQEIIRFPKGFWATRNFWAPEVHIHNGKFFLFVTLRSETRKRGVQIFRSDSPLGPFEIISDGPVTPEDWMCIDGTLYRDKSGKPYMVFCHEWTDIKDGTMCYAELSEDFTHFLSKPETMFHASDYPFVKSVLPEPGNFVTDGPFLHRCDNGDLLMIWSSYGSKGYFESLLKSDNGEINGKWIAQDMLFESDGGHGMLFKDLEGKLKLALHRPNSHDERLALFNIEEKDGNLIVI